MVIYSKNFCLAFSVTFSMIFSAFCRTSDSAFVCTSNQAWDGVQCVNCSQGCSCSVSKLEGACDDCLTGYKEYNPTAATVATGQMVCLSCSPECGDQCCFNYLKGSMVCLSCPNTYYLADWFCSRCLDPNCEVCGAKGVCSKCQDGYFMNSIDICQPCVGQNCVTCGSTGTCATCPNGLYVDSSTGNCLVCSTYGTVALGCLSCNPTIPTKCKTCAAYHYVDGSGKCREVSYCDTIVPVGEVCTDCADGYYKKANGKCAACPIAGAARCSAATNVIQCEDGKALVSGSSLCVTRILHCITYLSTGLCSVCDTQFTWLSSGTCYKTCSDTIQNCSACVNGSSATPVTCTTCSAGYFKTAAATMCYKCNDENNGGQKGCSTCSFSGTFSCSSCQSGFIMNAGVCVGCTPDLKGTGCASCSSTSVCSTCLTNAFTVASICYACDVSCGQCTDYGYRNCLTSCSSDLYYLDTTTYCLKCKKSMTGCVHCSSKTTCTKCGTSYYLSSKTSLVGTANQCQLFQGCKVTSPGASCTLCKPGYIVAYNGCAECQTQDCVMGCTNESTVIVIFSQRLTYSIFLLSAMISMFLFLS